MSGILNKQIFRYFFILLLFYALGFGAGSMIYRLPGAEAYNGDYSKTDNTGINPDLSSADWNNLPNDFIDKDGDAYLGTTAFDMNSFPITNLGQPVNDGDAANVGFVNGQIITGSVQLDDGRNSNMICGSTPVGATMWSNIVAHALGSRIQAHIFTTNNGLETGTPLFSSPTIYLVRLNEASVSPTAQNVYGSSSFGIASDHEIYVTVLDPTFSINAAQANARQWYITWCGVQY